MGDFKAISLVRMASAMLAVIVLTTISLAGFTPAAAQGNAQVGASCSINLDCESGACVRNRCVCREDSQCGSDRYCQKNLPGVTDNQCRPKRPNGEGCTRKEQCASGRCNLGSCKSSACKTDSDCGSAQYCHKAGANDCRRKRSDGDTCTRRAQCASDRCEAGACMRSHECRRNRDCPSGAYCDKGVAGIGRNTCKMLKDNGQGCTAAKQCKSGRCNAGTCKPQDECANDSDCPGNKYCDKGTAGIGVNKCKAKKSQGSACSRSAQCASDCCKLRPTGKRCRPSNRCN